MPKRAVKQPRRPMFKKRASAESHHERVINSILQRMPDSGVKRVRMGAEKENELQASVERKMIKTRATEAFLQENPQMIKNIANEHFSERRLSLPQPATPERPNRRRPRRQLFDDHEDVPSPNWDRSPDSNDLEDLLNNANLHFDPEGLVDDLGNANDIIVLEPINFFDEIPEQIEQVAVPMEEPAVPIEDPPIEYVDEVIRINFSISFVNDQYVDAPEDGQEALDAAIDLIENAPASPADINAFVPMEE